MTWRGECPSCGEVEWLGPEGHCWECHHNGWDDEEGPDDDEHEAQEGATA